MKSWRILLLLLLVLTGCSSSRVIKPNDAKARMEEDSSIVLVDVRELVEFNESRIPGAIHVPLSSLETSAIASIPDKEATYFIYCRTGRRSKEAIQILRKLGYKNLYDLGGILDWPYEIETGGVS